MININQLALGTFGTNFSENEMESVTKYKKRQPFEVYEPDDRVITDGIYVCVPCGHQRYMIKGETFGQCKTCSANKSLAPEEYLEGMELWEKK